MRKGDQMNNRLVPVLTLVDASQAPLVAYPIYRPASPSMSNTYFDAVTSQYYVVSSIGTITIIGGAGSMPLYGNNHNKFGSLSGPITGPFAAGLFDVTSDIAMNLFIAHTAMLASLADPTKLLCYDIIFSIGTTLQQVAPGNGVTTILFVPGDLLFPNGDLLQGGAASNVPRNFIEGGGGAWSEVFACEITQSPYKVFGSSFPTAVSNTFQMNIQTKAANMTVAQLQTYVTINNIQYNEN